MKPWQIVGLMTLPVILFAAFWIYHTEKERNAPVNVHPAYEKKALTADETVVPRKLFIDSVPSAKALIGKPVWLQSGYQLNYFPYKAGHIDFAHEIGFLPAAQELDVKGIEKVATPASFKTRLGRGNENIFMIFAFPESGPGTKPDAKGEYAAPFGTVGGEGLQPRESRYYFDDLLYYDDPHKLYSFWPADVWKTIDAHEAKAGMSEMQTTMSLGQIQESGSKELGNRTVEYTYGDHADKKASVTFVNDKATTVKAE